MLTLYKVTGKPVYLLDSDVDNLKVTPAEQFSCANLTELEQEVCYGTGRACNTLFAINRKTKTVQYIRSILEEIVCRKMHMVMWFLQKRRYSCCQILPDISQLLIKKQKKYIIFQTNYKKEDDLKCDFSNKTGE